MGKPGCIVQAHESSGFMSVSFKTPSRRYADEFLRLKCAPDLLPIGLFPNFKEVTESMGAYKAVQKHIPLRLGDPAITAVFVGDGAMPRTAALFAYRTRWQCHSVDPLMRHDRSRLLRIKRLHMHRARIEDIVDLGADVYVCVHSHARIEALPSAHCVAIPCCVSQEYRGKEPTHSYTDWGIWSPERQVKVWIN